MRNISDELASDDQDTVEQKRFIDNLKFRNVITQSSKSIDKTIDERSIPYFDEEFSRSVSLKIIQFCHEC